MIGDFRGKLPTMPHPLPLFEDFAPPIRPASPLRRAITAATRRSEPECLPPLVAAARLDPATKAATARTARRLIEALRAADRSYLSLGSPIDSSTRVDRKSVV